MLVTLLQLTNDPRDHTSCLKAGNNSQLYNIMSSFPTRPTAQLSVKVHKRSDEVDVGPDMLRKVVCLTGLFFSYQVIRS